MVSSLLPVILCLSQLHQLRGEKIPCRQTLQMNQAISSTTLRVWTITLKREIKKKILIGPRREKTCLRGVANNTGADQPAHPRSLISAFVIRVLKSTISKLASSEISVF